MSQVSNVLLSYSAGETPSKIQEVNIFFTSLGYDRGLVSIEDDALPPNWYGGNKPFESELLVGAFNFLDSRGFLNHIKAIQWAYRESVQVFLQEQWDNRFKVFRF